MLDDVPLGLQPGAVSRAWEPAGELEFVCTDRRLRSRLVATRFDHVVAVRSSIV